MAPVDAVRLAKALPEPNRLFFLEDLLAPEEIGFFACCAPGAGHRWRWASCRYSSWKWHHRDPEATSKASLRAACGERTACPVPRGVSLVGMAANGHLDLHVPNFVIQKW